MTGNVTYNVKIPREPWLFRLLEGDRQIADRVDLNTWLIMQGLPPAAHPGMIEIDECGVAEYCVLRLTGLVRHDPSDQECWHKVLTWLLPAGYEFTVIRECLKLRSIGEKSFIDFGVTGQINYKRGRSLDRYILSANLLARQLYSVADVDRLIAQFENTGRVIN